MTKSDNCSDIQTQGSSQTHTILASFLPAPAFLSASPASTFSSWFSPYQVPTLPTDTSIYFLIFLIVALQYCASFCCIGEWISHRYAHIPLFFGFPNCSLCGSFAIYVLHTTRDFSYFSLLCLKILWFLFDLPFDLTWSLIDFGCGERIHGFLRKRLPSLP